MNIKSRTTKKTLKSIEKITGGRLTLGKLIWAIRESDAMSQTDFALKLGISKQHLCDLEHDRKSVSPKLAMMYAEKLGYSPEQFVRLALQDMVNRAGIKVIVEIKPSVNQRSWVFHEKFKPLVARNLAAG